MTLESWCQVAGNEVRTTESGSKYVVARPIDTYYVLLWHLKDYCVSSVTSGNQVNMVPKVL